MSFSVFSQECFILNFQHFIFNNGFVFIVIFNQSALLTMRGGWSGKRCCGGIT